MKHIINLFICRLVFVFILFATTTVYAAEEKSTPLPMPEEKTELLKKDMTNSREKEAAEVKENKPALKGVEEKTKVETVSEPAVQEKVITEKATPADEKPADPTKKNEVTAASPEELEMLKSCKACGKSIKELRDMGLSEEEIKKEVHEKLELLNKITQERRRKVAEAKKIDFSEVKDCIACGKRGADLQKMGLTPEQIREAYKEKFLKMKEMREKNLKSKQGQQLSEKIKEAYGRQKVNQAAQLKAELDWMLLLQKKTGELKQITPQPDFSNAPASPEGMVFIPGGGFQRGLDWDAETDNDPVRMVDVSPFFMDKYEIKVSEYKEFMKAKLRGNIPYYLMDKDMGGENQPAFSVDWKDAKDFCELHGKRLPTEAEWEKAARGWDNRHFTWGNELPDQDGKYRANYNPGRRFEDGYRYTSDVGAFETGKSPYGIYDMTGNVWEWVSDWYDPEYYKKEELKDPKGPAEGVEKVVRGGGFDTPINRLLLTTRLKEKPDMRRVHIGFRCAKSP